jgi:hypothetical protein
MTYERLKAFCEANNISMSQFVETRVGDFLGSSEGTTTLTPIAPRPTTPPPAPRPVAIPPKSETRPSSPQIPMTSAAARYAVEPPPPVIKKLETSAPKPTEKRPDQIFTF